jgi:hypothetical protein
MFQAWYKPLGAAIDGGFKALQTALGTLLTFAQGEASYLATILYVASLPLNAINTLVAGAAELASDLIGSIVGGAFKGSGRWIIVGAALVAAFVLYRVLKKKVA